MSANSHGGQDKIPIVLSKMVRSVAAAGERVFTRRQLMAMPGIGKWGADVVEQGLWALHPPPAPGDAEAAAAEAAAVAEVRALTRPPRRCAPAPAPPWGGRTPAPSSSRNRCAPPPPR